MSCRRPSSRWRSRCQNPDTIEPNGSFKGWLLKTTQWRIHDQFRRRLGHVPWREPAGTTTETGLSPGNDEWLETEAAGVEDRWDEWWEENLLAVAIEQVKERVDPREFQVFDLAVRRDWPPLKVAEKLNVTRARVYCPTRDRPADPARDGATGAAEPTEVQREGEGRRAKS